MNAVKMLEDWVKRINPKAEILKSDSRCGKCYAVTYQGLLLTDFLPISELKQFLYSRRIYRTAILLGRQL